MIRHSLLDAFNTLVNQHYQQFRLPLRQLRTTVETTVQQLQAQEQPLVAAQAQVLSEVQAQLAIDARVLINSTELDAFVIGLIAFSESDGENQPEPVSVRFRSAEWLLAQTDIAIRVADYATTVEHDTYDDERTYSSYGYGVTLYVQDQPQRLEVLTRAVYSPVDQYLYSVHQQLKYNIESDMRDLIRSLNVNPAIQPQLVSELSCLVGCAAQVFSLVPQMVQFQYSNPETVR